MMYHLVDKNAPIIYAHTDANNLKQAIDDFSSQGYIVINRKGKMQYRIFNDDFKIVK